MLSGAGVTHPIYCVR